MTARRIDEMWTGRSGSANSHYFLIYKPKIYLVELATLQLICAAASGIEWKAAATTMGGRIC
jgi:hypothetical protein